MNTFNGVARYTIIRSNCEKDNAGGTAPGYGTQYIKITNYASAAMAAAGDDLITGTITVAESEALEEEARMDAKTIALSARQDVGNSWSTILSLF